MASDVKMVTLLPHINKHFFNKEAYFKLFAQADTRVESWFKGELIFLFEKLKGDNVINGYNRETSLRVNNIRKQIDFKINLGGQDHYIELKAPCISKSSTNRDLKFYFRDNEIGLIKDFNKLSLFSAVNKWVLAFFYPNPGILEWNRIILTIPENLNHWKPITKPDDYPAYLFISLWKG